MTLKEKYTTKNKKRIKQFIVFYSILVIFLVIYSSFAKYDTTLDGHTNIAIANWKIVLNGQELTNSNNTLTNKIVLTPETNIDETDPTKIKPEQTGYFDIEINPADTEVSFVYQITLDTQNSELPETFKIKTYSINNEAPVSLPDTNIVNNTVYLGGKNIFTSADTQTIRFYWSWESGDYVEQKYTLIANVEVKQVL